MDIKDFMWVSSDPVVNKVDWHIETTRIGHLTKHNRLYIVGQFC